MALTDEDKAWFKDLLGEVRSESKTDVQQLKADIQQFKAELERVEMSLNARIERVETSLLTEFHKWASPVDARLRTRTAMLRVLDLEMEVLNDRLKNLEHPPN